jgi:hypothetical protein
VGDEVAAGSTGRRRPLVINVKIDGLRPLLRAFRDLPKEASDELRDEAGRIAQDMADWIAAGARGESKQAALVAGTTKVRRDRVPVVEIGGASKVGTGSGRPGKAYEILFGANFGARSFPQFRSWAGRGNDYFVFSQIEAHEREIENRYLDAADRVIQAWSTSTAE